MLYLEVVLSPEGPWAICESVVRDIAFDWMKMASQDWNLQSERVFGTTIRSIENRNRDPFTAMQQAKQLTPPDIY